MKLPSRYGQREWQVHKDDAEDYPGLREVPTKEALSLDFR